MNKNPAYPKAFIVTDEKYPDRNSASSFHETFVQTSVTASKKASFRGEILGTTEKQQEQSATRRTSNWKPQIYACIATEAGRKKIISTRSRKIVF